MGGKEKENCWDFSSRGSAGFAAASSATCSACRRNGRDATTTWRSRRTPTTRSSARWIRSSSPWWPKSLAEERSWCCRWIAWVIFPDRAIDPLTPRGSLAEIDSPYQRCRFYRELCRYIELYIDANNLLSSVTATHLLVHAIVRLPAMKRRVFRRISCSNFTSFAVRTVLSSSLWNLHQRFTEPGNFTDTEFFKHYLIMKQQIFAIYINKHVVFYGQ